MPDMLMTLALLEECQIAHMSDKNSFVHSAEFCSCMSLSCSPLCSSLRGKAAAMSEAISFGKAIILVQSLDVGMRQGT